MDWEPWIHLAHTAGAVVWVGGGVMLSLIGLRARRSDDFVVVGDFAGLLSYAGLRLLSPALVVVLLSGLWLVLAGSEWNLTQPWLLFALGAFVGAFLIGVLLSRSAIELERIATGATPDLKAARAVIGRWLGGYIVVLALLGFALWDMVFKPGT